MNSKEVFDVKHYEFSKSLLDEFRDNNYVKDLWPVVYILSDHKIKEAYIGETTDTHSRITTHLKNNQKNKLTTIHLIASDNFNKSATLDIESNLIKYISADGQYTLLNGNLGLANHTYFEKKKYGEIFSKIWNRLRTFGITKHSLEHINNSDLFKYSPYKSLTTEQKNGLISIIEGLLSEEHKNIIIEGGAGTGKTILAIFIFKILNTENEDFIYKEFGQEDTEFIRLITLLKKKYPKPKMALVVPMDSFRTTLKKVFKNIKGLRANMVMGPTGVVNDKFDIVIVDESHRLRRRVNLGTYFGAFDKVCAKLGLDNAKCSELDWVLNKSKKSILFYDEGQSIKPSDARKEDFQKLKDQKGSKVNKLKSQFRVKGGNGYVQFVDGLLNCKLSKNHQFSSNDYDFLLYDSIEDMVDKIEQREEEQGLSRMIAGFSWKWISKNDKSLFDIDIEGVSLKWNGTAKDWINSENAVKEVGCIHTTQGYDLNYAGVIFGNEITYNKEKKKIEILEKHYFDKNGKNAINNPQELKNYIINIYKTILLRGIKGTYIYACDKNLREYLSGFIPKIDNEVSQEIILPIDEVLPFENSVPLFDLKVAAGEFGDLQQLEDVDWVKIPSKFKPSKELFACTVIGKSMNKVIPDGSICLFRKYTGGSRNGKIVLVEYTDFRDSDFGSCYTIKEYHSKKLDTGNQWKHESIILKPLTYESDYEEIILEGDDLKNYRVIGVYECVL